MNAKTRVALLLCILLITLSTAQVIRAWEIRAQASEIRLHTVVCA